MLILWWFYVDCMLILCWFKVAFLKKKTPILQQIYSGRAVLGLKGPGPSSALARIGVAFWEFCGVRFAACVFQFCEFGGRFIGGGQFWWVLRFEFWGRRQRRWCLKEITEWFQHAVPACQRQGAADIKGYRLCSRPLRELMLVDFVLYVRSASVVSIVDI